MESSSVEARDTGSGGPAPDADGEAGEAESREDGDSGPEDADRDDTDREDADREDANRDDAENTADRPRVFDELVVEGRAEDLIGFASSANEGVTGRADLDRRPLLRAGEIAETTPGVMATQHSGGGKANQFFLRGFNLDHGTDFSVRVAGVPVNMPSHGHGQGYADLNFLIPELVQRVHYRKGPYDAALGDFSTAGGMDLELVNELPQALVQLSGGSYSYGRALWAQSFAAGPGTLLAGVSLFHEDGPWRRDQDYDGWKGLLRYTMGDNERGFSLSAMAYDADWLSTDQVPRRLVDSGQLGRFDLLDPGPRGDTQRVSLSVEAHRASGNSLSRFNAYLLHYDFGLISNFTYFLEDPQQGDQFEQADERQVAGFDVGRNWYRDWQGRAVELRGGLQGRYDSIDNGLFRTSDLERIGTVREDSIDQLSLGLYSDMSVRWSPKVRSRLGLRADFLRARVDSDRSINSGSADDLLLSPRLSLIFGPWRQNEIYLNYGQGFHSNDARGSTLRLDPATGEVAEPLDLLVRARSFDLGLRNSAVSGLHTTLTLFVLELDSELVFVGDGGATEASRPSRRRGIEWTNVYTLSPRWSLDLDLTLSEAEFTDDAPEGDEIPGAVGTTVAAGLSYEDPKAFFAALRWRYLGDVPLVEDGSQEWSSSSLVNARFGYHFRRGLTLGLEVFNLLDREASDIEYFYASRLPGEPSEGIEDVHFHPMEPRTARLVASWRW